MTYVKRSPARFLGVVGLALLWVYVLSLWLDLGIKFWKVGGNAAPLTFISPIGIIIFLSYSMILLVALVFLARRDSDERLFRFSAIGLAGVGVYLLGFIIGGLDVN